MFKNSIVGMIVWVGLALLAMGHLGVISVVLLSGPLVAVPLALPFVAPKQVRHLWMWTWFWLSAVAVVLCFFVPTPWAWVLALPWFAFAIGLVWINVWRLRNEGNVPALLTFGASCYLVVAALWLIASRAQLQPLGFREPIVELTSAHFHFAGFASAVIASRVAAAHKDGALRKWAAVSAIVVGGAPLSVALGHLWAPAIELTGGVITSIGLLFLAMMSWLAPVSNRRARLLVRYCSFPLILTMALALQYGLGRIAGEQALSYETVAAIHGGLNALVFSCGSLLGWRLEATSLPESKNREELRAA